MLSEVPCNRGLACLIRLGSSRSIASVARASSTSPDPECGKSLLHFASSQSLMSSKDSSGSLTSDRPQGGRVLVTDLRLMTESPRWQSNAKVLAQDGVYVGDNVDIFNLRGTFEGTAMHRLTTEGHRSDSAPQASLTMGDVRLAVVSGLYPHHLMSAAVDALLHQLPQVDAVLVLYAHGVGHAAIVQRVVRVGCTQTLLWFGCPCLQRASFIMPWWEHRYHREGLCRTFASVAWMCSFWPKAMVLSPGPVWKRRHLHHCHLKNLIVGTICLRAVWQRTATTVMGGWQPTRRV